MSSETNQIKFDNKLSFWAVVEAQIKSSEVGVFQDGSLLIVAMKDNVKMEPIVRNKEELFSDTVREAYKEGKYKAIINGPFYDITNAGLIDTLLGNDPIDPKETLPEGKIIKKGKLLAGRAAPRMFYIANYPAARRRRYVFGYGIAPKNAQGAIGGCGPLIINSLPYGEINKFGNEVKGKQTGEPIPKNKPFLTQRSNATFRAANQLHPTKGKTIIAHSQIYNKLLIIVLPDNKMALSFTDLKDKLLSIAIDNAVFLDGSNSSLLMVDGKFLATADQNKDETNTVGVGFKY